MKISTIELCKRIFERYESLRRVEAYYGLLAYYALAQTAIADNDEKLIKKCREYLDRYPDSYPHPKYNFEAYRVGGNAKAWMFCKQSVAEWESDLRKYAELTMKAPAGENGILCFPGCDVSKVWIDTVACVTPFMLYTGIALGEEKYMDFAAEQCFKMYDLLMDKTNGLVHQSKGFMANPKRVSADHWSRGNGWGYVGLSEMMRALPRQNKYHDTAKEYYLDHTEALLKYQAKNGLWRQEIPDENAWYEASGTGLILYGLGIGIRKGVLCGEKYKEAFRRGIEGMAQYCLTDDFATHRSCPGCLCPGKGDNHGTVNAYLTELIPSTDEVHSFGAIMLAMLEAHKNGIYEVEIPERK